MTPDTDGPADAEVNTGKRPSWKDILWAPIYDFVDTRWGTRGLRLFAISIGLVVVAVAWWGLKDNQAQSVFLKDIVERALLVMVAWEWMARTE